ncbi:MAG: TonB-dependent receptor [Endozoicomonas sp. (ex Botrylloides leachii)]|nr:TonB-dependent receptor [Endozoicomonas sp. (ex Botrylloides leachii)]
MFYTRGFSIKPKKALTLGFGIICAGTTTTLLADNDRMLDEVIVTASRRAETAEEALAPVTIITRKQIEQSQATSVAQLLSRTPGLQIASNGGAGSLTGVYLRGTKTAQTLVILDGQKINSPTSGSSPLQYLTPEQIDKIEIVRGPRSSLYGADAIGGVIQIFTRKTKGKPLLFAKIRAGSRNTDEYAISFGTGQDKTHYNIGANTYKTDGYDHTLAINNGDDDNDTYRNDALFGSFSHFFANKIELGGSFSYSEGQSDYDNNTTFTITTQPYNLFRLTHISGYVTMPVNDEWDIRIEAGYGKEHIQARKKDRFTGICSDSYYSKTDRYSISWKNNISWSENHLLTSGLDYSNEWYSGSVKYNENAQYNIGIFLQSLLYFDKSDLQASLRTDKSQAYHSNATGSIAYGYSLFSNVRIIASYGTAFRAPTLVDLYYPGYSNPNLKPEKAKNYELELKGKVGTGHWGLSVFQNTIDDMISATKETDYKPTNIDKALIQGLEVNGSISNGNWNINASISLLKPENRSHANYAKILTARSKQLMTLTLDHQFKHFGLGASFKAQGSSYADVANNQKVPGFGILDLRGSLKLTAELKASIQWINVFDKTYQPVSGYRGEPKGVIASLIWTQS